MLAAYLDGKLDATQRGPVEDHVSRCEDCYFVVRETAATGAELGGAMSNPPLEQGFENVVPIRPATDASAGESVAVTRAGRARPSFVRRYLLPIAATLIVGVGAIAFWRQSHPVDAYAEAVRPLVEAVGERRFFEPRLTGGFKSGALVGPTRGSDITGRDWPLLAAAARIKAEAEREPTSALRRALGAAELTLGQVDEGVATYRALAQQEETAAAYSDLAAALLLRASSLDRASDLPSALEASQKARKLDSGLVEAMYNEALALEQMGFRPQAIEAWRRVERSERGGWSAVAAEHAARLEREVRPLSQREDPEPEPHQLLEWASEPSFERRAIIETEGAIALSQTGDSFLADAARQIQALGPDARARAITAVNHLGKSVDLALTDSWAEVATEATMAEHGLKTTLSIAAPLAVMRLATAEYYLGRLEASRSLLLAVLRTANPAHLGITARAHWLLGTVDTAAARTFEAGEHQAAAVSLYDRLGQLQHRAFMNALLAQSLFDQGYEDDSWRRTISVFRDAAYESLRARRRFTLLGNAARRVSDEHPLLAAQILGMGLADPAMVADPSLEVSLRVRRGRAALRAGDAAIAKQDHHSARGLLPLVGASVRDRWAKDVELLSAELEAGGRGVEAVEAFFRQRGDWLQVAQISERLADADVAAGRFQKAITRLEEVVALKMKRPANATLLQSRSLHRRIAVAERRLTDLTIQAGDPWRAFPVGLSGGPTPLESGWLPTPDKPDLAFIRIWRGSGDLSVWWVWPAGKAFARIPCMSHRAQDLERCLTQALLAGPTPFRRVTVLQSSSEAPVNWARVFSRAEAVGNAPVFELGFVASGALPVLRHARNSYALLMFSRPAVLLGQELPALPRVDSEASAIRASGGEGPIRQIGMSSGSSEEVARALSSASVLHIGGHLLADRSRGAEPSFLAFGADGKAFAVTSGVIAAARPRQSARIVVLNVCAAASRWLDGPVSLAEAFLEAGAEEAIAPVEPVEDRTAEAAGLQLARSLRLGRAAIYAARETRAGCRSDASCAPYVSIRRINPKKESL
jgi:tetratricopeptide (TPR) repeat protein